MRRITTSALLMLLAAGTVCAQGQTPRAFTAYGISVGGNQESQRSAVSGNGQRVAFDSSATNLVPGDTNRASDVFVADRQAGTVMLVSRTSTGGVANGTSSAPAISSDGRYVVFQSTATNLVSGDTNGDQDIFRVDLQTMAVRRVSVTSGGLQVRGWSYNPSISADGRYVAFETTSNDFVPVTATKNIIIRDMVSGLVTLASRSSAGVPANYVSDRPLISDDGRYVSFRSSASNLADGTGGMRINAYRFDRLLGTTILMTGGLTTTYPVWSLAMSGTGNEAVFAIAGHMYAWTAQTGAAPFFPGLMDITGVGMSGDGRYVMATLADGLYYLDRVTRNYTPIQLNAGYYGLSLSSDGRYVSLDTMVKILPTDTGWRDVYLLDAGIEPCSFSVTLSATAFVAIGGATVAQVATAPGCTWSASALGGAVVNPQSGSGNGSVTIQVPANSSTQPRTLTVVIAGTTFTLSQSGETTPPPSQATYVRYLAEGATSAMFDTRIALANPGTADASAVVSFLRAGKSPLRVPVPVQARRRVTLDPKTIAGLGNAEFSVVVTSDQPLVVDRTMSWDVAKGYGAHSETAVSSPSLTWYLAEGATHNGFNLFYLLQNPNEVAAQVRVRYLRPNGAPLVKTYTLPASSRTNIWVNQESFDGLGQALASTDVSAVFEVVNGQPIIVERAVYLDRPGQLFAAGHESAGVTAPATQWFLAEGATGPYFDLFVLVANPNAEEAKIQATFLLPDGSTVEKQYVVAGNSRFNIWVDQADARLADTAVSTTVRSVNNVPVIVERAMWWPGDFGTWYEAHNSPGATQTGTRWAMAEGEVGGARGVDTYILLANPTTNVASVRVTLMFEDQATLTRTFSVGGNSRFNVDVRAEFPEALNRRFGAVVESLGATPAQVIVERAMYWNAAGQFWSAGTNALAERLQ